MKIKLFTVQEANKLLPEVRRILNGLRVCQIQAEQLEKEKAVEELSWLQPDGSVSSKAQAQLSQLEEEQKRHAASFESGLEQMGRMGAQLKDLDQGLVDFLAGRGDERVCLCWKEGEESIRYWHDQQSGFAGRRPVEELG